MNRTSGYWYLLVLVPIALLAAHTAHFLVHTFSEIEAMPRVVVPGSGDVELGAGDHVVYFEARSKVDDTTYYAPGLSLRCTITAAGDNAVLDLSSSSASSSYSYGDFQGQSVWTLTTPSAGTYHVTCSGEGGPGVIAFGEGIVTGLLIFFGVTLALIAAIIVIVVVVRRKRKRRV